MISRPFEVRPLAGKAGEGGRARTIMQHVRNPAALFVVVVFLFACAQAHATIALDGTPVVFSDHATATCTSSPTITTSGSNEILVAAFGADTTSGTGSAPAISSVSGSGLTWHNITTSAGINYQSTIGGDAYITTGIYWALAPTAGSYGVQVTYTGTIDNCANILAAVSGANTSTPLDTNGSLPATNGGSNSSGDPSTSSVSTSCSTTLILQSAAYWNNSGLQSNQTTGTGFSTVSNRVAQTGSLDGILSVQYGVFSSAQTGQTFSFGTSWPGGLTVVAALQDASATCGRGPSSGLPAGSLSTLGVGE